MCLKSGTFSVHEAKVWKQETNVIYLLFDLRRLRWTLPSSSCWRPRTLMFLREFSTSLVLHIVVSPAWSPCPAPTLIYSNEPLLPLSSSITCSRSFSALTPISNSNQCWPVTIDFLNLSILYHVAQGTNTGLPTLPRLVLKARG